MRARDTSIVRNGNYETKPASGNGSYLGYGGLTYRRPAYCYGDPVSGFYTNGLPVFGMNELPGTIEAELFDYTPFQQDGRTYHSVSTTTATNQFRPEQDFQMVEKAGGGYALANLEAGEWLSYTVHIPATGKYKLGVRYAGSVQSKIRFWIDGRNVTGDVVLQATGSSSNWVDYTVAQNITLSNRVQNVRVHVAGGMVNLDAITIEADAGGPASGSPPDGLSVAPQDATSINLNWNGAEGASQYNLKRSNTSGGPYDVMAIGAGSTNHTDVGLLAGTNYYYVISTVYDGMESSNSLEVVGVPSAPINPDDVIIGDAVIGSDGGSGLQFSLVVANSGLGHRYQLKSTDDLIEPVWQNASGILLGNGGALQITVPVDAMSTNLYYRLEAWRQ